MRPVLDSFLVLVTCYPRACPAFEGKIAQGPTITESIILSHVNVTIVLSGQYQVIHASVMLVHHDQQSCVFIHCPF